MILFLVQTIPEYRIKRSAHVEQPALEMKAQRIEVRARLNMLHYFMTMIPLLVAASTSTLSTPVPARPMIFKLLPALMTSAVTLVADRTTKPS